MHPFGCPVFVLDKRLCNGGKTSKWNPRSTQGMYLGLSPEHASNVILIFNLMTRHVSPQFHVVYDEDFTSVNATWSPTWPAVYEKLFTSSRKESPEDFDIHDTQESPPPASPCTPDDSVTPATGASLPSEGDIFTPAGSSFPAEGSAKPPEGGSSISSHSPNPRREGGDCTMNESDVNTPRTRIGQKIVRPQRYRSLAYVAVGLLSLQLGGVAAKNSP